jgi:hypothetical protein
MIERELTAAERHVELLVDIAMTSNHPKMLTLVLSDAVHIFHARKEMARIMFILAVRGAGRPD